MKLSTKEITHSAIFAALICIMSLIALPVGAVPATLSLFGIMLVPIILGKKQGVISVLIYLLSGAAGLPVFSGFKGGFQVLLGPTGGYLWSYILIAYILGKFSDCIYDNTPKTIIKTVFMCFLCLILCYLWGSIQYTLVTGTAFKVAIVFGGLIFLPFDILKVILASYIGTTLKKRIRHF